MRNKLFFKFILSVFIIIGLTGCTFVFQSGRRSDVKKIEELSKQIDELSQARDLFGDRLRQEIQDKQVKLEMMEKGLVISVVGDVLFDSGKDQIRTAAYKLLDKIAGVLQDDIPLLNVGIEGHTDNQPIKYSKWKSNWELSSARALSVLHYLVDKKDISPARVSANGYGEHQPVALNDTVENRQQNRRVEIVILPKVKKINDSGDNGIMLPLKEADPDFIPENLK